MFQEFESLADLWLGRILLTSGVVIAVTGLACLVEWCCRNQAAMVRSWLWRLALLKVALVFLLGATSLLNVPLPAVITSQSLHADIERYQPAESDAISNHNIGLAMPSSDATQRMKSIGPMLLLISWLPLVVYNVLRLNSERNNTRRLIAEARFIPEHRCNRISERICRQISLNKTPRILFSSQVSSPMVAGFLRTFVLLPESMATDENNHSSRATDRELQMVLCHELIHIKRHDLHWNWLPTLLTATLFFHPVIWFATRRWHVAHELACDQLTLKTVDCSPREYGAVLLGQFNIKAINSTVHFGRVGMASSFHAMRGRLASLSRFDTAAQPRGRFLDVAIFTLLAFMLPTGFTSKSTETDGAAPAVIKREYESDVFAFRFDVDGRRTTMANPPRGTIVANRVSNDVSESISIEPNESGFRVTYGRITAFENDEWTYDVQDLNELKQCNQHVYEYCKTVLADG